jgi:hypothetical protein
MGKVSVGLRGWRFEESEIFDDDGQFRPFDEIPHDPRHRLMRLTVLVGSPCDACWLIYGDEDLESSNRAEVVYGEPLAEVLLCADHEHDFMYWYQEVGGSEYRGEDEFQEEFHEWFAAGHRAPDDYSGIEHVDTDPDDLPDPPPADQVPVEPGGDDHRIDLQDVDLDIDYPG